jgi:hypothetical protein
VEMVDFASEAAATGAPPPSDAATIAASVKAGFMMES